LVGRELQGMLGQTPQQCFLMPILVGTDGTMTMSKSLDNYVGVEEPPNDMYGKLMSLPDNLIVSYFEYLTDRPEAELAEMTADIASERVNPMLLKKELAHSITAAFHDAAAADAAQANFERVVQQRDLPEDIPEFALPGADSPPLSRLLVSAGLAASNSEAKRLLQQRAVEVIHPGGDAQTVQGDSPELGLQPGDVIKVGKRRFVRLS
ncbi:MAG: tyrosine--tRNA ligase, partial [Dehalococcoidia bacterium]